MKFIAKIHIKFTGLQVYKYIFNTLINSTICAVLQTPTWQNRRKPCKPVNFVHN